jgi:hypothetical protein
MSHLIGKDAHAIICDLGERLSEGSILHFFSPAAKQTLRARVEAVRGCCDVVRRATQLSKSVGIPFWDAVSISCLGVGNRAAALLSAALFHHAEAARVWEMKVECLSPATLSEVEAELSQGSSISLSSLVTHDRNPPQHIPMLDFACSVGDENRALVVSAIELLNVGGGYLLVSGRSYHFYGAKLLSSSAVSQFLGRALLLAHIVDHRWIAHQLIRGYCSLRISPGNGSRARPTVVSIIGA